MTWQYCKVSEQLIHCRAHQLHTSKKFCIKFIYGFNHEQQRQTLWTDIHHIAQAMNKAWCQMGDFNTILHKKDRIGGDEITVHDLHEMQHIMEQCELHEMRSTGTYYSWTNKTIWSKIDTVLHNNYWHNTFDFTQASYMAHNLSDHTPICLQFPSTQKPKSSFGKQPDFKSIVLSALPRVNRPYTIGHMGSFLTKLRPLLSQLHRSQFKDIR